MTTRHTLAATAGVAALLGAAAAEAATVTIDEFDEIQRVEDVIGSDGVPPRTSEIAAGSAVGGFRDIAALNDDGNIGGTTVEVTGNGHLSVNNQASTSGVGTITWDGNDGDGSEGAIDAFGLGGVDLLGGGADGRFEFNVLSADFAFDYELTVFDADSSDTVAGTIPGGISSSTAETIAFSAFSGVDFASVGAIQLAFAGGASADLLIDRIDAVSDDVNPIPVPASLPLLGAALMGVGLLSRRKWKSRD